MRSRNLVEMKESAQRGKRRADEAPRGGGRRRTRKEDWNPTERNKDLRSDRGLIPEGRQEEEKNKDESRRKILT